MRLVKAVLARLQDEVAPSLKGPWVYRRSYEESPGAILIREKTIEDGDSYTDEYWAHGVAPKNLRMGTKLLEAAWIDSGLPRETFRSIVKHVT